MHTEFEVRVLDINKDRIIEKLELLGANKIAEFDYKRRVYNFNPATDHKWIRLRTDGNKTTLTIKKLEDFTIDGKLEHGKYFCWYRDNNEWRRLHIASNLSLDFQWPHDGCLYINGNIYKEYFYNDTALLAFKVGDKIYMREQYCLKFYLMPREPIDDKDAYDLYFNNKQ